MATRRLQVKNDPESKAAVTTPMVFTIRDLPPQVMVRRGDDGADALSILDLFQLGATTGSVIEVAAAGEDEELAIAAITAIVLEGFGEDTAN